MSPAELGEKVGLKEKMVYRGEQKSNFSPAVLINIAKLFNDDLGQEWLKLYLSATKVATPSKSSKREVTPREENPVELIITHPDEIELITYYRKLDDRQKARWKDAVGMTKDVVGVGRRLKNVS